MKPRYVQITDKETGQINLFKNEINTITVKRIVDSDKFFIHLETESDYIILFEGTQAEVVGRYLKICEQLKISSTKVYL